MTVGVDERWNFFVVDCWRHQATVGEAVIELYRQWNDHGAIQAILQKVDARGLKQTIETYGYDYGRQMPCEWVAYTGEMWNAKKLDRIRTILEPRFRNRKIFLHPGMMEWFANEEYLDFPQGEYFDALDALCNVAFFARPPQRTKIKQFQTPEQREVAYLKQGIDITAPPDSWESLLD
jgi:hypothetical protein